MRRRLFITSLLTTIALASTRHRQLVAQPENGRTVIVIGAGIAGLAAANTLKAKGYEVTILEARQRIGGRIWTERSLEGIPLDMGASWIHGITGNPIMQIAQANQIATLATDYDNNILYNFQGKQIDEQQQAQWGELFTLMMRGVENTRKTYEAEDKDDISLGSAIARQLQKLSLSNQDRQALNFLINATIEHEYAADVSDLSLYEWDQGAEVLGGDVLFPDGYDQIVKILAAGLDIRLNQAVSEVAYSNQGVKITTSQEVFAADYVVITLPLGVLKAESVKFSPVLPQAKRQVIQRLGMGLLNKLYLKFPEPFWAKEPELINYIALKKGEWSESLNFYHYIQQPVLLCFNAGSYARRLEEMSEQAVVREAMGFLTNIYGKNIPFPQTYLMTRWLRDPYTRGSYSYAAVNSTLQDRALLASPVENRLFFAGEATHQDYPATVHGAYLSGLDAAEKIFNIFEREIPALDLRG